MSKSKVMKSRNPFSTTLGQFETGDAPRNYTNLTFFPSQQLDKFYEGSKIGDTDVAQVRLNNEELFRKDPFYQAKLNLLNPIVSATKYIENKSVKEMQEECDPETEVCDNDVTDIDAEINMLTGNEDIEESVEDELDE